MKAKDLRNSILQLAVQGKLVPQDNNDEPASALLERIKSEKEKKLKKQKSLEPISVDEIPFDIPESWEWTRLGQLTEVMGGKRVPKGEKLIDKPTAHVYIRVADMKKNSVNKTGLKYITENVYDQIKRYTISKHDLYLTIAGTIGNVGIIPEHVDNMNLTENAVKLCGIAVNKHYIMNAIMSDCIQKQFAVKTNKVAQPKLAIVRINSTIVPLPPLAEQQLIVDKLEQITPLIDEYEKLETELTQLEAEFSDKLKKSILQYAVQGKLVEQNPVDEPASVLIERIKEEKEKLIKEKKIKKHKPLPPIAEDEIPFDIPENWEWVRLGEVCYKLTDGTHSTPKYTENGVPFLSVKDMSSGKLDFSNTKFISKGEHDQFYKRCNPERGDLLLTKVGTTGIPVVVDTDTEFSLFVSVALLKFGDQSLNLMYLKNIINSPLVAVQAQINTKGVGNKNWVMRDIANTIIPVPPLDEQNRIVKKVDELLELCGILADEKSLMVRKIKKAVDNVVELPLDNGKGDEKIAYAARGDAKKSDLDIANEIFNGMFEDE